MPEMQRVTVEWGDVRLVVQEATTLIGMKRARLKTEAIAADETDEDRRILRIVTYPDVVAATVSLEGMEMPGFDEFCELPEPLINAWLEQVYLLNPHWLPTAEIEQAEKKVLASASSSSPSSKVAKATPRRRSSSTTRKATTSGR